MVRISRRDQLEGDGSRRINRPLFSELFVFRSLHIHGSVLGIVDDIEAIKTQLDMAETKCGHCERQQGPRFSLILDQGIPECDTER